MGEVGFVYRSSVALGCLILMFASIACTGWFFYSWLGGIPGIVGAGVGCAVQLMAYGFSGVIVHQANGVLRVVLLALIASALALSVLSSYATLNGYFTALQQQSAAASAAAIKKEQALQAALSKRMQLMDSMSRDVEIGSEAADQGLADKYRTQANQFLQNNAETRDEMEEQIAKVEALALSDAISVPETKDASPIDGLAGVLGGQTAAIMLLCIWLAVMFDALPIVGITLFESKKKRLLKERAAQALAEKENDDDKLSAAAGAIAESVPESDIAHITAATLLEEDKDGVVLEVSANHEQSDESKGGKEKSFRLLTNICSTNLPASKSFFTELLNLETKYDSDWYLQLCSPNDPEMEFGVIQHDHELIPGDFRQPPSGMYMTFVVPDVNATYDKALQMGVEIVQEPRNEFYGQRRFLAKEPSGCLVDICSPWDERDELEEELSA